MGEVLRQTPEISESLKYYSAMLHCRNCGARNDIYVPKGQLVPDAVECERCGCLTNKGKRWVP